MWTQERTQVLTVENQASSVENQVLTVETQASSVETQVLTVETQASSVETQAQNLERVRTEIKGSLIKENDSLLIHPTLFIIIFLS